MNKVLLNTDGKGLKYYGDDENKLGMIHVITGDGKGKTTASIGLCIRSIGAGFKVLFVQFFKMNTNELEPLKKLGVDIEQFQFLGPFFKKYTDKEFNELQEEFSTFWNKLTPRFKDYDLVVLDEIVYIVTKGVYPENDFLKFLERKPKKTELILTGRDYPKSIKDRADYVSEVRRLKHPFDKGVSARKGVEF